MKDEISDVSNAYVKFQILKEIGEGRKIPLKVDGLKEETVASELNVMTNSMGNEKFLKIVDDKYFLTELGKEFFKSMKIKAEAIDKAIIEFEKKIPVVIEGEDFMKMDIPKPDFQIEGLATDKGITIVAGYQSAFKTHVLIHFALCLINGAKAFDKFSCKKVKVWYINQELNEGSFQETLKRISEGCGLKITNDLIVSNFIDKKIDVDDDFFLKTIEKYEIKAVIIDSFRECFIASENSADEITEVLTGHVRPIMQKTGCSFYFILHRGKMSATISDRQKVDFVRGSSVFRNYADSIIFSERYRLTERTTIEQSKIRGSKEIEPFDVVWMFENNKIFPKMLSAEEIDKILIDDCKKELMSWIKQQNLVEFKTGNKTPVYRKFIESGKYSQGTFYLAIKELIAEGKLIKDKRGLYRIPETTLNQF